MFSLFKKKYEEEGEDNIIENDNLLDNSNDNIKSSYYTDPINKKINYLIDFDQYKLNKKIQGTFYLDIKYDKISDCNKLIKTLPAKYYSYDRKFFLESTLNIKPDYYKGKININISYTKNKKEYIDSINFNFTINECNEQHLSNICINSINIEGNYYLITTKSINNEYYLEKIRYISDNLK